MNRQDDAAFREAAEGLVKNRAEIAENNEAGREAAKRGDSDEVRRLTEKAAELRAKGRFNGGFGR